MTRRRPESTLQRSIRNTLAQLGFSSVHTPNGSRLAGSRVDRAKHWRSLQADGALPGFPDLIVYARHGRVGHMEVKAPKGEQTDTQRACQEWLESIGHHYALVRSEAEAVDAVRAWGWL